MNKYRGTHVDGSRWSLVKVNSNIMKYFAIFGQIAAVLNQTARNSKSNHWLSRHTLSELNRVMFIKSSIRFESRFDFAHHCVPLNDSSADDAVCGCLDTPPTSWWPHGVREARYQKFDDRIPQCQIRFPMFWSKVFCDL